MRKSTFSFLACVLGVPLAEMLLPGMYAADLSVSLMAGAVLGIVYLLLRPVVKLITFPFAVVTLGLLYVVLDAGFLWLVAEQFDGLMFESFGWALAASMLINLLRGMLRSMAKPKRW